MRIAILFLASCGFVTDFERDIVDGGDAADARDSATDVFLDGSDDVSLDVLADVPLDAGTDAFDAGPCEESVGELLFGAMPALVEGEEPGAYTIELSQPPTSAVAVFVTPDEQSIADAVVEFTVDDWNSPQTIAVEAIHDFDREGSHETDLVHRVSSADPCFAASAPTTTTASIEDRAHITHITVTLDGSRAGQNLPSVSDDGRFVVFEASGSNLVSGDTNGRHDVFLRDTLTNTTLLVSQVDGMPANGESRRPKVSADGSVVVFSSRASNLASPTPLPSHRELYVYEIASGDLQRVTPDCTPTCSDAGAVTGFFDVSGNGEWIAYETRRALVPEDTDSAQDIYLYERATGETTLASVVANDPGIIPAGSNGNSTSASLSRDGRYLVFASKVAGWFDPEMPPGNVFAVLRDLEAGTAERVSALHGTTDPCVGSTGGATTSIAADATRLMLSISCPMTFASGVPDTNNRGDIVSRDLTTLANDRVTVTTAGAELTSGNTSASSITDDGTLILWRTDQAGIVAEDTNGAMDAFVYDTTTNMNERVSVGRQYEQLPSGISLHAIAMSRNGQFVVFQTTVSLVTADTNGDSDLYMLQRF